MAKKRTIASEPSVSAAGTAPTRRRAPKRSTAEPSPAENVSVPGNGAAPVLDPNEIARLAYSYWLERGCQGGSPEDDWLRAERELKTRRAATAA